MATGGGLIGALRVTLGLDTAQFEAGTKRARGIAQRDTAAIQKSLAGIKGSFDGLVAAASVAALTAAAKRALDYASSLGEVAQQVGVTTKELQEYRYAASQVGISNEEMDKALTKLTRTIGEAKAGSKEQATAFRDLGVSIQDANGRVYSAGELIPRLADALSRLKDPAIRARYEVDLFGKTGQKLDTLLAGGSSAVNDLTEAARKLGLVLSDRQIQNADDTADKLSALKQVLEARISGAVADNATAIVSLANALLKLAGAVAAMPPEALGILSGAAVGGRFGGLPGALAGAAVGLAGGQYLRDQRDDANGDPVFRARQLKSAIATWRSSRQGNPMADPGGKVGAGSSAAQDARATAAWSEVQRQWGLFNTAKANAAQKSPVPVVGDGALPTVRPGHGKKAPKDRTEEKLERFNKELGGLKEDELSAQQQLTTDVNARARFEQMRLDTEQKAYEFDVDSRVKQGDITAAQGEQLKLAKQAVLDAQRRAVDEQRTAELDRAAYALTEEALDARAEQLRIDLDDARTSDRRREINIKMLDLDIERQRELVKHLQALRDLNQASDAEVAAAEARLQTMEGQRGARARQIGRENAGPMQAYLNSLPHSADELKERFEAIKVDALNNGLDVAANQVVKLKGLAGQLFNQLINDVIRLQLQSSLTGGGNGLLGSLGKFWGIGGTSLANVQGLSTAGGLNSAGAGLGKMVPGMAGGGTFRVGGIPGVDRNVLAINGIPRARVSHNENVSVGYGGGSGESSSVEIVPSKYFDAVVDGRAAGVASDVYATGAQAGARRSRWKL